MGARKILEETKENMKETDIIARIQDGDKPLYNELIKRRSQMVYRIIRAYTSDEKMIESVVRNTFFNAYWQLYKYNGDISFQAWLMGFALQEYKKQEDEKRNNPTPMAAGLTIIEKDDVANKNLSDSQQLLQQAIDMLPTQFKVAYMMKHVEDFSMKEMCSLMDVDLPNMRTLLYRSREKLRDKLFEIATESQVFQYDTEKGDSIAVDVLRKL